MSTAATLGNRTRTLRALDAVAVSCVLIAAGCTSSPPAPGGPDSVAPPMRSEPPPPISIGGQSGEGDIPWTDDCVGELQGSPNEGGHLAFCSRAVLSEPGVYHCCCDPEQCGRFSPECYAAAVAASDDDAGVDSTEPGCHVQADTCAHALTIECGVESEAVASCVVHSTQVSVPCFARAEGGYRCDCPNLDVPGLSELPDCLPALRDACAGDCESPSGRCSFGNDRKYHCECSNGLVATSWAWACENALPLCEPACQSDTGACYGDPFGWSFACQCDGESDWHVTAKPEPGELVYNCDRQLADFCGR